VVYTGDLEASPEEILKRVKTRLNIELPEAIEFIYLRKRRWVEAGRYPMFTLLGQSLGSLVLGWEALNGFLPGEEIRQEAMHTVNLRGGPLYSTFRCLSEWQDT